MGRSLTPEERNVRGAMIELLALYYLLQSQGKEKWFHASVIQQVSKICYLMLPGFEFARFNKQDSRLHFYLWDRAGGGHLHLPERQLALFIRIISAFHNEYPNVEVFRIAKIDYAFSISPEADSSTKTITWTKPKVKSRQGKTTLDIARKGSFLTAKVDPRLDALPDSSQVFNVLPNYDQSSRCELANILFPKQSYPLVRIPTPCMDTRTDDFIDLVRYVFVKYHHLFGSFKHIKICGYLGCRKLYMELRERKRDAGFCRNNNCRVMHHRKKDSDRYTCRDRQNAWIRSKIKNTKILFDESEVPPAYHVYQDECVDCDLHQLKGGRCPKLIEKNIMAMKEIENHYATRKR